METWYLIVDCNTFYASVEKIFRPELRDKPVVVLSNNDGIVVALSKEAKKVGFKRGDAIFKKREEVKLHNVAVFSSNYELYYDFSRRVNEVIKFYYADIEKYSVDEFFIKYVTSKNCDEIRKEAVKLKEEISKRVKIPVSIGIACNKTLAKVMNRHAKKDDRYKGVCILKSHEDIEKALKKFPVEDIWGIGWQNSKKIHNLFGINYAWDFSQLADSTVKKHFTITGLRTVHELRGKRIINIAENIADKKQILCSRSFGQQLTEPSDLKTAISNFVVEIAQKLRIQKSVAKTITVFLHTNYFKEDQPQFHPSFTTVLPIATNDNFTLLEVAIQAFVKIFKEGYKYKKAGVYVTDLMSAENVQLTIFDDATKIIKRKKVSKTMDEINSRNTEIEIAIQSKKDAKYKMRQDNKSPCYTTKISDIPVINIG